MPIKNRTMTVTDQPSFYECCGFLDLCTDRDLMSLSFAGAYPFLDWLNWSPTTVCEIKKWFLTWVRPDQTRGECSDGVISDPCGDAEGVEWGGCGFELRNFGRLRLKTPVRDITKGDLKLCVNQPLYRLDGSPITDMMEYDMSLILREIIMHLQRQLVTGHTTTPGDGYFDGLQQLIKTNYTDPSGRRCASMDSIVIEWNHNTLAGGAGITWNGAPVAATYDFVQVLTAVLRNIKQRISWSPALGGRQPQVGDIVLMMPTFLTSCLLDMYTCWSQCVNQTWTNREAQAFRNSLNGGLFGAGRIFIEGFEIPLAPFDFGTIQGPTTGDIYVLTGRVGGTRLIEGQYLDMRGVPARLPQASYDVTDGGRLLTWTEWEKTCYKRYVEMQPRLLLWAPWAQARFENIVCNQPGPVLSPDPCATSYFPETSFHTEECLSA